MSAPRRQQPVSLRGASAREISRDALLEKVAHERELRSYARRAAAAALFIQRVWRRYYVIKKEREQLQEEWEAIASQQNICESSRWISNKLIRPFIFFTTLSPSFPRKLQPANVRRISTCFQILLQSMTSTELEKNFCFLAIGTAEEKCTWLYQAQKLVSICLFVLAECDLNFREGEDLVPLTVLAMRLAISLTDSKGWKGFKSLYSKDVAVAVKKLIIFISTRRSGMYVSIRKYMMKLGAHFALQRKTVATSDDYFLITASAVTLTLRPFHAKLSEDDSDCVDAKEAYESYLTLVLTIPYLTECLPSLLLPALKHVSVLLPCLNYLITCKDKIFDEILKLDQLEISSSYAEAVPSLGWALVNIINLATDRNDDSDDSGCFVQGLDCRLYVRVINCISENFLSLVENFGRLRKKDNDHTEDSGDYYLSSSGDSDINNKVNTFYIDLLKPVNRQWHLRRLLTLVKEDSKIKEADHCHGNLELVDAVLLYYHALRIYTVMNPFGGSLCILNVLAFMPGFLVDLWEKLENFIFHGINHMAHESKPNKAANCESIDEAARDKKQRRIKETGSKWVNVLQKITGKSVDISYTESNDLLVPSQANENADYVWDVEPMRRGPQGISKDLSCMLHLFCATYAHLLLVLDDIEFYEKQVPFTLEQQRKITSVLNTFVYNSFVYNSGQTNKPLMDVTVRCLHLLYERDCRHKFCPASLWLEPATKGRIPIAAAARAHEAASSNLRSGDTLSISSTSSVLTTLPHVYPFEERVQMFREFIKLDKISRRAVGEVSGPGPGSIEIVVRRDHIIEDGFRQLNSVGSRLKSSINVSFVSECGLSEAGLDYGGLSKEFLTDLSRAAFNPQYGLFSQSSTSERFLMPNMSARLFENGMEMIEFLGRVVGKALYEGILLDYSFSLVFVQKLLGRYSYLDELSTLDPELYKNLIYVKHFDGDVAELSLDFTVTEELCGKLVVTELKPGGRNVSVTNENKLQYVHAIADYKLNRQILPFSNAFYRGLIDIISPAWLSLFNANEFNQLLSGGKHDFDVDDLRSNTRYTGGYSEGSRTIKLFWEVIKEFTPSERGMLLKFVTSCSRAPLLGFKHLQPSFTIHKVPCDVPLWATFGGQDVDRLPSASTCYNTLKLPTYKRSSTLRSKLLYAISSNAGFELS